MIAYSAALTLLALFLPLVAAVLAPALINRLGYRASWLLALMPFLSFLHFLSFLPEIADGGEVTGGYAWVPSYNVSFSWYLDGLSLTFALLITGIGTLIVLYAGAYMKGHAQQGRFLAFLLLFMGAMLGLVMSDSFLMLFIYWELTSITSFLLIGFDHERQAARRAALQALVITGGGGLALLAGLILLWNVSGVTQLSMLLHVDNIVTTSPYYLAILLLILGGAFTKSAQFPFHVWLPNAMEAPTPVSAYLHSATMVKAGVYLLMRLQPVLGDTPAWQILLPFFGGITLIVGSVIAVRQTDLKLMLAYTTVASLGLMVMLTGFGSDHALAAAVLYLIAHSLFKGALFMVAGCLDHEAGSRDLTDLSGLKRAMPITFVASLLAGLSMAGLPPLFGFLAKEEIYAALYGGNLRALLFTGVAVIGNALMMVVGLALAFKPFLGRDAKSPATAHDGPALLWLGPLVLALVGLAAAVFSAPFHKAISSPMLSAVARKASVVEVSLVPHIGVPLALSVFTIALGLTLFLMLDRLRAGVAYLLNNLGPGPDEGFDRLMAGLVRASFRITNLIHGGRLDVYVTLTLILVAAAFLVPMAVFGEGPDWPSLPGHIELHEAAFLLIAVSGLYAVLRAANRLDAIVALGIQGFAISVIFLLFGAPDLSFTQFMIETLSVVILALAMTRLKLHPADHRPWPQVLLDGAVALACGTGLMLMLLKVTQVPFDPVLTAFFNTYSKTIAHGANVVNVIIVDFRGVDTLGEIAVVTVTGLAILALIRIRAPKLRPDAHQSGQKAETADAGGAP
ncbi:putative monovalent cation/H+ antiporter subunit A [Allorhizobium taibaishanense]|uniref:Multicomponent Na+:H+ antiporter subunit A n=1 Tax=Allorhizobium taibaishanense TaxID=887144 RepID=A0A1Q8ZZH7_9HYPH|nr:putative monovalent cation/H+ antiporter subunit A [Allorhizobium taibaishanense]MBB4007260.1 multicomponent Na+:H+ antiporter subunit A [Allorhizobium taibaishanense]OLP47742.1 Na(+)/H(+) antiporter subunit A [Allorhizobium taibaishanense]